MASSTNARLRFPDHLPLLIGMTGAALIAGRSVVQTAAEINFGRPSSTAALGFVIGPLVGVIFGAVIFAMMSATFWALHRAGWRAASRPLPSWIVVVLALGVGAVLINEFRVARRDVLTREAARVPRILLNSSALTPLAAGTTLDAQVTAPVLFVLTATGTADANLQWNGRPLVVDIANESVFIKDQAGATLASVDLHAYDYIRRVSAMPVCAQADGRSWLAVLTGLRATSNRSMLTVFDTDGRLVYQEHLERTSGPDDALMAGTVNGVPAFAVNAGTLRAWRCSPV